MKDENRKNGMKRFFWWQYQPIEEARNQHDELYGIKVNRIRRDDTVFAAALEAKEPGLTDEQREKRRSDLKKLVSDVVDLDIQERSARIDRLKRDLDREVKALNDLKQPEGFQRRVGREVDNILNLADGIVRHRHDGRGPGNGAEPAPQGGAPGAQPQ